MLRRRVKFQAVSDIDAADDTVRPSLIIHPHISDGRRRRVLGLFCMCVFNRRNKGFKALLLTQPRPQAKNKVDTFLFPPTK